MSSLPSGTVTFLMTDIQGSTVLWERHPEAMQIALARHEEIMSAGVAANGGVVVKHRGEGDSVFAVFARPSAGITAACQIQAALHCESWPLPTPLLVRMALHTGEAELRGNDYFGTTVNRCARLRSIAHGGQVLVSGATVELVQDGLPSGVRFRDLGQHRLRDLTQPERVFQLLHPSLPNDFPPLQSLDMRPQNLPVLSVPLVGRSHEVSAIKDLLLQPNVRLVTLTGPGGIGKTRLGLQVTAELIDHFEDGVFFVNLAPVEDPSLVVSAIAQTLDVRESSGRPLLDILSDFLRGKHLLFMLDNFEQVLPAAAHVATLLGVCPGIKFLVTSRAVLHLTGEHVFPVPPLSLPSRGSIPSIEELSAYEAINLFVERARAVRPDFALNHENVDAVITICQHLDGLPLAIELAAARVRLMPPQAMVRRLTRALPLLTGGARDLPARQQTLRGAIAWSYDLLDEPERALFRRLAVFVGGCTLEAMESVVTTTAAANPASVGFGGMVEVPDFDDELAVDLLDGISALLDASLLDQRETADGEPRYRMLGVIREFGMEQLALSGESEPVQRRHAEYYLRLAETAEPELHAVQQKAWLERLHVDHDNLRAALAWSREHGEPETYLRLAGALFWFWYGHGHWSEGRDWTEDSLARYPDRTVWRAKALYGAGGLNTMLGHYAKSRECLGECVSICRDLGERLLLARALSFFGVLFASEGQLSAAQAVFDEALPLARAEGDGWTIAVLLRDMGRLAGQTGDVETARSFLEESVRIHRQHGEWWALAHAVNALGDFMRSLNLYQEAGGYYEESLQLFRDLGITDGLPSVLHNLAYVSLNQGDVQRAANLFQEALRHFQKLGDQRGIAECIVGVAGVLVAVNQLERAAWLFGAAQALLDATGTQISSSNITDYGRSLVTVTMALGEEAYSQAYDAGRLASTEQAIAEVLKVAIPAHTVAEPS